MLLTRKEVSGRRESGFQNRNSKACDQCMWIAIRHGTEGSLIQQSAEGSQEASLFNGFKRLQKRSKLTENMIR